jgi:PAS domain S-box-containing protein
MPLPPGDQDPTSAERFVSSLVDRLRPLTDPDTILSEAARSLGVYLGADRVCFGQGSSDPSTVDILVEWTGRPSEIHTGPYPAAALGLSSWAAAADARTFVSRDILSDSRLAPEVKSLCAAREVAAIITAPLVRGARLAALLSVSQLRPHPWTAEEEWTVREIAEQIWPLVELARAATSLQLSEERLRVAVEAAEMGTWDYDIVRNQCWWSRRTCEIWGIEYAETLPGDLRYRFVHPEDEERYRRDVDDAVFSGKPFQIEYRIIRPDGQVRWVLLRGVSSCDANGSPVRATGIALDNSERREADERLRESRALLDAFMRNAPVGMYLKDSEGRYVMVNPEMAKVLGVRIEQAIGRSAEEILGSEEAARIAEEEQRAVASGQAQSRNQYFPDRTSHSSALLIRFPLILEGRRPQIGGFAIDTTEQMRAEAELKRSREALHQSEKMSALGSLLAGLSHELNNPLSVVVGQALIMEEKAADQRTAARAGKIRAAAERCARIVQTFLAMARQREPERQLVDVNEIIDAALDLTAYGLRSAGVAVRTDFARELPVVVGDAGQLHQLFANLIINAQHALETCRGTRELSIATRIEDDRLVIDVCDNGDGIAPALRGRIFEPFFTTKPVGAGTGLGLSFAYGVARAHGGELSLLETETGAHFRVVLPAEAAALSVAQGRSADPVPLAGRALVVDDEADLAETLCELLEHKGWETRVAHNGEEAIRQLDHGDPDLIIADIKMPGMDGPALHAWLSEHRPALADRVVFLTGDTLGEAVNAFLKTCGRPFIEKPFSAESLSELIRSERIVCNTRHTSTRAVSNDRHTRRL